MKLASLELKSLRIPFRVTFKHASAERSVTQAMLAVARSQSGITGYGEGCPRDYVTGETEASVASFFETHRRDIASGISDLASLRAWCERHEPEIDDNPAAWCALELAMLDLFAREENRPVESLIGLPPLAGPFMYSAVLGAMGAKQFAETLARYQKLGLSDYKIKLSGNAARDRASIAVLRDAGIVPTHARADANNLWSDHGIARDYLQSLDFPFAAVEEPLCPGQFNDLARLAQVLSTRIVLDESIVRQEQLAQLPGEPKQWIVNLRVSKMGGLLRSLRVVQQCRARGVAVIVGAQVGETSLLTRAALIVAQAARDILLAQEGAFGTMLLESDAVRPTLMFGAVGVLDVKSLGLEQSPGFGLAPIPELERYLRHNA